MRYRAVVIGAGRIGAGWQWGDLEYTHAGAYRALSDRVELVGFVEPNEERAQSAKLKWQVPVYEDVPMGLKAMRPDIVSVCVQPEQQKQVYLSLFPWDGIKAVWQEKPFNLVATEGVWQERPFTDGPFPPIQVNYMRRGDFKHRILAECVFGKRRLIVYGKDDIHTRCHFKDLAKFWNASLDYRQFNGPCAYVLREYLGHGYKDDFFDNGGVDGGECMRSMLGNLLDNIEGKEQLWSPATG